MTRAVKSTGSSPEALVWQCQLAKLPLPVAEFMFAPPRKWAFDLAWLDQMLACEIDGAVHVGGRHTRGVGYENDCVKLAEAMLLGWRVLRLTTGMVASGQALNFVERALKMTGNSSQEGLLT